MEYYSDTPLGRNIKVDHEKPQPVKWSTPEEFSDLRPIPLWLKKDYSHIDAVLEPEPPLEDLSTSYLKQLIRLQLDETEIVLAGITQDLSGWPTPMAMDDKKRIELLSKIQGYWISAWHPNGYPTPINGLAERDIALNTAIDLLRPSHPELQVFPAAALQELGSWVEGGAILNGVSEEEALEVARRMGQFALVEIGLNSLRVIPVDSKVRSANNELRVIAIDTSPCPMLRGCETQLPCKRYGGPYGGRAIAAAGYWRSHRAVAISRLGCSLCEAGKTPFPHGSLNLSVPEAIASRHGTATRIDPKRAAQEGSLGAISPVEKANDEPA